MKKLINDPSKVTDEMVEGLVTAFPNLVKKLNGFNVVVREGAPIKGKVGIVAGGARASNTKHPALHGGKNARMTV